MGDLSRTAMDALLHTLGHERGTQERSGSRNRYVTSGTDPAVAELVAAGLMVEGARVGFLPPGDRWYQATERGESLARGEHERTRPKMTAGRRRYLRWLTISDFMPDLSFSAFLKRKDLHEAGR